jgi:uncharacterized membrane-anchored protein YitT (DUF2179 family)
LIPNNLASGGLTGLTTILEYATNGRIPMDFTYALLNIALLVAGFLFLGKAFGFKTIYVIALSSFLFWLLPNYCPNLVVVDPNLDKIMIVLIGGAMESIGIGMILLRGGSTGGTDIVAMMIQKYFHIGFSNAVLIADSVVVLSGLLVIGFGVGTGEPDPQGWLLSLYSLITIYVTSRVLEYTINGASSNKLIFIILNKHNEVLKDFILKDLDRSATYIQSRGMYTNEEKEMIFLVVPNKDVPLVHSTIQELDPTAFIVVTDAYDTFGEGFKPLPSKDEIQNI